MSSSFSSEHNKADETSDRVDASIIAQEDLVANPLSQPGINAGPTTAGAERTVNGPQCT
jgi:hypothetical protein